MAIKTALITGASGGIGYELAKLFAYDGYGLVLVARSEDKLNRIADELEQTFGVMSKVIPKDLSIATAPSEIFAELKSDGISVDVVVNNAGFGVYGAFSKSNLDTELQMMQLNMVSLTHLTKLLLRDMVKRDAGKVLNVASTAAFQPGPLMAVYCASKAYVLHFSEALAEELRGSGVTVTVLCPGPTETGFQEGARMEGAKLVSGELMTAKAVAEIGYHGLMNGKRIVIPGWRNKLLAAAVRFTPRSLVTRMVKGMLKRENTY